MSAKSFPRTSPTKNSCDRMPYPSEKIAAIKRAAGYFRGSLERCCICPRICRVDRMSGQAGYCRAGRDARVYSYSAHHGEEPVLSGERGSGTIFFSRCNMKCAYCQNYHFSRMDQGEDVSVERLSEMMLELREKGCHNINLVNPTHYLPQIVSAIDIAASTGLDLPIVYNTSGYELAQTLRAMDGVIDIYLPDMRYSDSGMSLKYSDGPAYPAMNREAVLEMHRQVGTLVTGRDGIAERGLIIRLLVLPKGISGTKETLRFIADKVSPDTYLSIMSQYYPTFRAHDFPELSSIVSVEEYDKVVDEAALLGLNNGWIQDKPVDMDRRYLGTSIKPGRDVK